MSWKGKGRRKRGEGTDKERKEKEAVRAKAGAEDREEGPSTVSAAGLRLNGRPCGGGESGRRGRQKRKRQSEERVAEAAAEDEMGVKGVSRAKK